MQKHDNPARPWTWSPLKWLPGEFPTLAWVVIIHVVAIIGIIRFPWPGLSTFLAAYALMFLGGMGTTVAYHRSLAHKAVKLHPIIESVLVGFACFNGSGAPATWASNHRNHHANAETENDVSSPQIGGFWWSHLRWLWQASSSPISRWAPDMTTRYWTFWTKAQPFILAASFCIGIPFGEAAFYWLGAIRLCFALHAQCTVNSIAHMKPGVAPGEDSSQNLWWLGIFHSWQGENWHRNHHMEPNSAQLGRGWQLDVAWWLILVLEKLGLASNVRRPKNPYPST